MRRAFVIVIDACGAGELPAILSAWLADGHEVGSHTRSHRDINSLTLAAYTADVDAAHNRLVEMLRPHKAPLRYFRHPFLHAGNTAAKKQGLERHLRAKGYQIAVVTVDNQEWVFAEAYANARRRGDKAGPFSPRSVAGVPVGSRGSRRKGAGRARQRRLGAAP